MLYHFSVSGAGYGLTEEEKAELWRLISLTISTEGREFFVFGSRATGTARKYSDVDVMIVGTEVSGTELADFEEAFDQSDMLFQVDLVEARFTSPDFFEFASRQTIRLGEGSDAKVA